MKLILFLAVITLFALGCRSKEKDKPSVPAANFLVNDYIKGRVAQLDTSLLSFQKIETENGHSDTIPIKNSDIRRYAQDFLSLPDLSSDNIKDDYEVSHLYDDIQGAFIFTYTTKENHPVREQHVTVEPEMNPQGKSNIRSVYIDLWDVKDNLSVRKNMLWETYSFYVTTTIDNPGQTEKIRNVKIIWTDFKRGNK